VRKNANLRRAEERCLAAAQITTGNHQARNSKANVVVMLKVSEELEQTEARSGITGSTFPDRRRA
jgi:hypothetical protein